MALTNAQYNKILQVYNDRQLKDYRDQQARIRDAYQRIPELERLDDEISTESVLAAEALGHGNREPLKNLREKIRGISLRKKELLKANGLPEDYLELRYECSDCRDTGFMDGKKCHCFRAMQMKLLYQQSNVDQIVKVQNFEHFDLSVFDNITPMPSAGGRTNREYMRGIRDDLMNWVRDFDKNHGSMILMGNPGTGKTFLVNCISKAMMDSGYSVIYYTSSDFFESLSRTMAGGDQAREINDAILNCDLLIIDDLGTELGNSFTTSKLFYVINQRMVFKKSVIISTNLTFRRMKDIYGDRIVSRIMADYEILPLYGRDQRLG